MNEQKLIISENSIKEDILEREKKIEKKAVLKPIIKQYYSVRIEAVAPLSLSYRVLAETPEEALLMVERTPANCQMDRTPKPSIQRLRKQSASVYISGSSIIKLTKKY